MSGGLTGRGPAAFPSANITPADRLCRPFAWNLRKNGEVEGSDRRTSIHGNIAVVRSMALVRPIGGTTATEECRTCKHASSLSYFGSKQSVVSNFAPCFVQSLCENVRSTSFVQCGAAHLRFVTHFNFRRLFKGIQSNVRIWNIFRRCQKIKTNENSADLNGTPARMLRH